MADACEDASIPLRVKSTSCLIDPVSSADDGANELVSVLLSQFGVCTATLLTHIKSTERLDETSLAEAMSLAGMLLNVAVVQCESEQQKSIADHTAKASTASIDDLVQILYFCYAYRFSSGK